MILQPERKFFDAALAISGIIWYKRRVAGAVSALPVSRQSCPERKYFAAALAIFSRVWYNFIVEFSGKVRAFPYQEDNYV